MQIISLIRVLYVNYIKSSYNSKTKRQTIQLKMNQDLNRHFSKEDVQMANVERCFVSSVTKETQIKTTMRYHFTPTRVAIYFLKTENIKCW